MISRRKFFRNTSLVTAGLLIGKKISKTSGMVVPPDMPKIPIVLSTWSFGLAANKAAWDVLSNNGRALDAVETGVKVPESDPENHSVGLGGYPDRDGFVTLDACIMDENGNAGSVTFLRNIVHPISVARLVMEKTPHVMLSGDGALQFALQCGFKEENLLTEPSIKAWEEWKKANNYNPVINIENHDTIGMLAIDAKGNISGACSTSGLAFKMHGRVGDSPIIGAGLYLDNEVGGAVSTGLGELVMKTLGSFLVVELMRNGMNPQGACETAVKRIVSKLPGYKQNQVGFLAINKAGESGAFAIQRGFNYALMQDGKNILIDSPSYLS
jgi:N4-(beta-N-acetylglucosaminyl)-L-asparaginase